MTTGATRRFATLALIGVLAGAAAAATETADSDTVLITNATIWTQGPDGILEGADLLMRDGTIVRV